MVFARASCGARPRHRAPSRPRSRGAGASREVRGAAAVAGTFSGRARFAQPVLVNGAVGAVWAPGGRPRVVFGFTITRGKILAIDLVADPAVLREFDLAVLNDWRPVLRSGPIRGTLSSTSSGSNAVSEDRKRLGLHAPSATESSSSATSALTLRVGKRGMPEPSDHHESLRHDLCARARSDSKLRTGADN